MIITATKVMKRGFGTATKAIYGEGIQEYVEVVYPTSSEYQRDCVALDAEDASKLLGRDTSEINGLGFSVLRGHWYHVYTFENGTQVEVA